MGALSVEIRFSFLLPLLEGRIGRIDFVFFGFQAGQSPSGRPRGYPSDLPGAPPDLPGVPLRSPPTLPSIVKMVNASFFPTPQYRGIRLKPIFHRFATISACIPYDFEMIPRRFSSRKGIHNEATHNLPLTTLVTHKHSAEY